MPDIIAQKRKHVLWLQWLLVVATSYLLYFSADRESAPLHGLTTLAFIALNATLLLLPRPLFEGTFIDYPLVFVDIAFISFVIYLSGAATSDFYLFFFLVLMMAAAGQNLKVLVMGVLMISVLYAVMVLRAGDFSMTSAFLLRIPFLFIVGLFFGYLVYMQKLGEARLRAESEFTVDLFEFGRAVVQTEDLELLYTKIPRLIGAVTGGDGCELVLVERGEIVRRVDERGREGPHLALEESIHEVAYLSNQIEEADLNREDLARRADRPGSHQRYLGKSWKPPGRPAGIVAVYRAEEEWTAHEIKKFRFLTDQTSLALQYVELLKELETQARTDELTGLANYRHFSERFEEEMARAKRKQSILSLLLMDVDNFKRINDTQGHAMGDAILKRLAELLLKDTGQMDLPARRGGDEFVILLPETDRTQVLNLANRILGETQVPAGDLPGFSISAGCSTYPQSGKSSGELLEHADQALYRAKAEGRACARHYWEVPTSG